MKLFKYPWSLSNKLTKFFMVSHIVGWLIAWIQTIWIITEIKKVKKKIK